MGWLRDVQADPQQAAVLASIYSQLVTMTSEYSSELMVSRAARNAQLATYLSVIPFMTFTSANYLDFNWSSVNWEGIGDTMEEYASARKDLN